MATLRGNRLIILIGLAIIGTFLLVATGSTCAQETKKISWSTKPENTKISVQQVLDPRHGGPYHSDERRGWAASRDDRATIEGTSIPLVQFTIAEVHMADRLEVARDIVIALVANPNTALVKGAGANAIGEDIAAIYKAVFKAVNDAGR